MYIKTYTLLAQSPLIHFQSGQEGATLRATEVKPKLDRYLIGKLGREAADPWLIPGQKNALNYKLRFLRASGAKIVELGYVKDDKVKAYDIYYGNMGDGPKKKGVIADVSMTVVCMIPGLLDAIDEHIGDFFIAHNFGTMQDKGFGSFLVEGKDRTPGHIAAVLRETYRAKSCYSFDHNGTPFKQIKSLYSVMKSGVNFGGYQRSLLFLFMHEKKGFGNEKAWLKKEKIAPAISKKPHQPQEAKEYYYVRALLGVGDHLEFKESVERGDNRKRTVTVADSGGEIERLSSPILFKVIGGRVYYVARRLNKEIYGTMFQFSSSTGCGELSVPTEEQLGEGFIDEFLEYCFNKFPNVTLRDFPRRIQKAGEE